MNEQDVKEYIKRYHKRFEEFGYSPQTLGWGVHPGKHLVRYAALSELACKQPQSSVLDVGCGFADLYDFMLASGWKGSYTGVDIVPDLLAVAHQRHPSLDLRQMDLSNNHNELDEYDFVISIGIFGAALKAEPNEIHVERTLRIMWEHSRVAVCADFQSVYVDYQQPGAWHADPAWLLPMARKITKRLSLRMDYIPYEFALILYKADQITPQNFFADFKGS